MRRRPCDIDHLDYVQFMLTNFLFIVGMMTTKFVKKGTRNFNLSLLILFNVYFIFRFDIVYRLRQVWMENVIKNYF
jgi:hypothetical protein